MPAPNWREFAESGTTIPARCTSNGTLGQGGTAKCTGVRTRLRAWSWRGSLGLSYTAARCSSEAYAERSVTTSTRRRSHRWTPTSTIALRSRSYEGNRPVYGRGRHCAVDWGYAAFVFSPWRVARWRKPPPLLHLLLHLPVFFCRRRRRFFSTQHQRRRPKRGESVVSPVLRRVTVNVVENKNVEPCARLPGLAVADADTDRFCERKSPRVSMTCVKFVSRREPKSGIAPVDGTMSPAATYTGRFPSFATVNATRSLKLASSDENVGAWMLSLLNVPRTLSEEPTSCRTRVPANRASSPFARNRVRTQVHLAVPPLGQV